PPIASPAPPPPPRAAAPPPDAAASIRVATDKVDRLMNLVGELVINQSMVAQLVHGFAPDKLARLQEAVAEMERNTRELQERVMAIRMVPIASVFSRVPRLVHDLAGRLGKLADVQLVGEETELDKGVVEHLADPLTHLVRNALDHGIESVEERRAAGKPERGLVRVAAYHRGGNVVIEVSDDGRGLDLDRIRARAIERGLLDPAQELTDPELADLVFAPGFSTATEVSDVSGRGVGMDVVRRNVASLNGSVSLERRPGGGTSCRIALPLTLAILDGLCLKAGEQVYVLPLTAIVESLRPRAGQLRNVFGRGEMVLVRDEVIPLVRLHALFGLAGCVTDATAGLVILVEDHGHKVGLLVDDITGQAQVVLKSLESHYHRVEGLMGATILGDGQVALILDVQLLVRATHPSAAVATVRPAVRPQEAS
ncbi:MAG TPA: chemotaxis protein CheA, partial [Kofleriaceae bacterium]|nr:chemotaxis protein CheA [Kofleriaceae bacterium]